MNTLSSPKLFEGVELDKENSWVKLAELIPWRTFERKYAGEAGAEATNEGVKYARIAIGTLIIKEWYGLSDGDIVKEIQMNPYLQYFIGLTAFSHQVPFDEKMVVQFRKQVSPEIVGQLNTMIMGRKKAKKKQPARKG